MALSPETSTPLLAGLSLLIGCTPICDQAGLRRVAEGFTAGEAPRRRDSVAALREACPTLPQALASSLASDDLPAGVAAQLRRERADDPAWRELFTRTCRTAEGVPPPIHEEVADLRRACDLERYGLRAPDMAFARDDIAVFMLYEWLLGGRIDQELAAQVARPLLASEALAARGVTLPQGTIDLLPQGGPGVWISATAVSVDDVAALPLTRGWPSVGLLADHISPELREALTDLHRRGRAHAERHGIAWDARAQVLADRATPMATFIDTLYTATRAGFRSFELVVHDGEQLRGLPLAVPDAWFSPVAEKRDDSESIYLRLEVRAGTVTASMAQMSLAGLPQGGGRVYTREPCDPLDANCADLADLEEFLRNMKRLYWRDADATFRLDRAVTLQALVDLVDLVRGEDCVPPRSSERDLPTDDCLFWRAMVDLDPPIHDPPDPAGDG